MTHPPGIPHEYPPPTTWGNRAEPVLTGPWYRIQANPAARRGEPFVVGWLSAGGGAPLKLITNAGPVGEARQALLFPSGARGVRVAHGRPHVRDNGPFAACKPDRHVHPLPTAPAPPGIWTSPAFSNPPDDPEVPMADPLLPPALESARAAVPILDSLPAPGYATPRAPQRVRAMRSVENIYNLSGVLGHVGTGPAEAWIATDKTFPHALYEVMVMSAGTGVRPGLHDHSEAYAASVGAMGAVFAEHCANWELSPVISWSYDPATVDRESIQGEKRLHTHFIGRTAEEVDMVRARSTPVGQSAPGRQRRIVEEASVLAGVLVADCLDPSTLKALEPVAPLSSAASTATIQLRMRDGWDSLADPGLAEDLTRIHAVLRTIYDRIGAACLTGETGPWRRPALDPVGVERVDLPLSDRSREALGHYLGGMRPQLLTDVEALRNPSNRDRTTHIYPLADLAYSVCLSAHQGQVYTHVRVNVFSDLGGAGMSVLDGTVVKTRKGERTMTPEDEAHRLDFQRGYLDRVRHHAYGGHALFPLAQPSLDPRTARIGPGPTTRSPGEQVQAEGQAGTRLLAMTRRPARVAREERSPQASGSPSPPPSPSADTSSGPEL